MSHRRGKDRNQFGLFSTPLEEMIAMNNIVRVIDVFVDKIDLEKLGFQHVRAHKTGAPPYEPALLLKIYLYGYFNKIRSSRKLEAECGRNIEMLWLTNLQQPSYHTIASFRSIKPHRKALKAVFKIFNQVLDQAGLFGKSCIAVDGTKICAQNSKKKHISEEKINKRLEHHANKFYEYLDELDRADAAIKTGEEPQVSPDTINKALDEIQNRVGKLNGLLDILEEAQKEDPSIRQLSLTDPDARAMPTNNLGMVDIVYNVQSAVDDENCLIANFSVENIMDIHLLGKTTTQAKAELGVETLEVLADKGYHYGAELQKCADQNITTYVAYPEQDHKSKEEGFHKPDFAYDPQKDVYICPAGKELTTTGTLYDKKNRIGQIQNQIKIYKAHYKTCAECPFAARCLTASSHENRHGRSIERSVFEEAVINNRLRVINNRDKYKRRQAIVEHPFGTIKRSWGYYYTLLKGKEKVEAEYSLVFLTYNLRRAVNILGVTALLEWIKTCFSAKTAAYMPFSRYFFMQPKMMGSKSGAGKSDCADFRIAA
ncbi:MAG: IS1182 family transposase [Saprospiraceae bacterium]|nr:IS1182 family transposase [Saprospiraceae bacterium]